MTLDYFISAFFVSAFVAAFSALVIKGIVEVIKYKNI